MKNIVKIIIFIVAIIAVMLAVWFAIVFSQDQMDKYNEVLIVNENNPEMIAAFEATTIENLPEFVSQYRTDGQNLADELKAKQLQKDILYTYITELGEQTAETFSKYQDKFPSHAQALFAKATDAQAYIDGFNGVADFSQLSAYINKLDEQYSVLKQDYIQHKKYYNAYNSFVNQADAVDQNVSETKRTEDLNLLKSNVKHYLFNGKLLNVLMSFTYVLFIITLALLLFFAVKAIFTNGKSSMKTLIILAVFAIVVLVGYLLASPELTESAIRMQLTPANVKWIVAGMFVFYVAFFGAIIAVLYAVINGLIKNKK